jgi:hypothetical protein
MASVPKPRRQISIRGSANRRSTNLRKISEIVKTAKKPLVSLLRAIFLAKVWNWKSLSCLVAGMLLAWNWQLTSAALVGVIVMLQVPRLRSRNWQRSLTQLQCWVQSPHHTWILPVLAGGITTVGTYLSIEIWETTDSPWIAAGAILQGLGTLAVLLLLLWQLLGKQTQQVEERFHQLLSDLSHPEPLKRLIAVRQLTRLVTEPTLDQARCRTVSDALQLLLPQESQTVIRAAVLDGLHVLSPMAQRPVAFQRVIRSR